LAIGLLPQANRKQATAFQKKAPDSTSLTKMSVALPGLRKTRHVTRAMAMMRTI